MSQKVMCELKTYHIHAAPGSVSVQEIVATIILNGVVIGWNHIKPWILQVKKQLNIIQFHMVHPTGIEQ